MFPFRRFLIHRRVVVNLMDGTAITGVMFTKAGPLLVVKDATLLFEQAEPQPLDGDVVVERSRVSYIQAV